VKTILKLAVLFIIQSNIYGQTDSSKHVIKKILLSIEGRFGASFGNNFYAFNIGGPSLRLAFNKNLKIGVGALPSFYFRNGKPGARLGVSPRIDYKRFAIIAPFYHFDSTNTWIWTIGLAYRIN